MDRDKNLAAYMQGSHAVDEAGNPLRLYHGTADDFSEFRHEHPNKKDAGWLGKGFYFSNSPAMANSYAMLKPGKAENVMPVHLSLRNPFYATMEHKTALKNALLDNPYAAEEFRNQLIEAGHDGVILDYGTKDNVKEYVAFHPTQIKSATGNQGTFDPSNPDITKADGGEVIDRATNFAKWFGRSKLVDQNGNPMVLYHGTDRDFSKFNPRKHGASDHGWYGVGHYLTADPSAASAYSAFRGSNKAISGEELHEGANVMPVHARLENPYIWPENRPAATSMEESIAITRQLMNMGYDGVIAPNYYDDGPYASHHEVVVFRPHQIKSATGNNGDYSPIEADITKADGGALTDDEGITAYHGTPHDFEQFDTSKIGTGEGAQAYGHGLYFAQNEDVAKDYRDRLSGYHPGDVKIGDEQHPHWARREIANAFAKLGYDPETSVISAHYIDEHKGDLNKAVGETWLNENIPDSVNEALLKAEYAKSAGHMYEVHIDAHPDHLLDWDRPIVEQPHMMSLIKNSHVEFLGDLLNEEGHSITGKDLYEKISNVYNPEDASSMMNSSGIKGIKYLDAGSRGDNEAPTHNYVVFDHDHVRVRRKYMRGGAV